MVRVNYLFFIVFFLSNLIGGDQSIGERDFFYNNLMPNDTFYKNENKERMITFNDLKNEISWYIGMANVYTLVCIVFIQIWRITTDYYK